jgi:dTDP-4-amino-4,6-dideoxygalactose transaminase
VIPILDLTRQYNSLQAQIEPAVLSAMASGQYILGPYVQAFEEKIARYLGAKHAIGCANGSDALYLALRALQIGPGDEVITTAFSYVATSESIVRAGATPVFVDIDPLTFNLDPNRIAEKITPNTKAIMPVHLYGHAAEMTGIKTLAEKHGLFIVEDAAQAIGSRYQTQMVGTIGDIGCFSFFPTKNLGAFGDGGLLTTNDDALAERLRMLRVHGSRRRYYHDELGINSRLDALQAVILSIKLDHLNAWTARRREIADFYTNAFSPLAEMIETPKTASYTEHVFHQYTLTCRAQGPEYRDTLAQRLQAAGVQSMIYYPLPLYRQETHANLSPNLAKASEDYPVTERVCHQVLSLPMFPEITEEELTQVARAVTASVKALAESQLISSC